MNIKYAVCATVGGKNELICQSRSGTIIVEIFQETDSLCATGITKCSGSRRLLLYLHSHLNSILISMYSFQHADKMSDKASKKYCKGLQKYGEREQHDSLNAFITLIMFILLWLNDVERVHNCVHKEKYWLGKYLKKYKITVILFTQSFVITRSTGIEVGQELKRDKENHEVLHTQKGPQFAPSIDALDLCLLINISWFFYRYIMLIGSFDSKKNYKIAVIDHL